MTPFVLVFSFFAAAATPAQPVDQTPAVRACASSMLPHFQTPSVPVSFQVPAKQQRPHKFNFATVGKRYPTGCCCDGTQCGCDIAEENCIANCNGDPACEDHCEHLYIRCALCCCCEGFACPPSCG